MENRPLLIQTVIRLGLLLMALRIVVQNFFVFQYGGEALFSGRGLPIVEMGLVIAVMIFSGYNYREKIGYQLSIQEGFLVMLGVYAVASLGTIVYQLIWVNYLAPGLLALAPDPAVYSFNGVINNFFTSVVMGSIFALVFAFVLSKRKAKIL